MGCGDAGEETDTDSSTNTLECGPNSTLHVGLGNVEPHCDCNEGFKLFNGNCIPDIPQENDSADNDNVRDDDEPEDLSRALPIACWRPPGSECDPRGALGCNVAADETCDIAQTLEGDTNLVCLPGPNTQALGESCDPGNGPFCSAGLHCAPPGVCKTFCCGDSDCGEGLRCQAFSTAVGSLGVCDDGAAAPTCGSPGASCQVGSDCCSNHCHAGHCH